MATPGTDPAFRKSSDCKILPALRLGQVVRFSGYRDQQLKIAEQVVPVSAGHCMGAGFSLGGAYKVLIWVYIAFRNKHRSLPFCAHIARSKTQLIAKRSTCTELVLKKVQVPRIPTVPCPTEDHVDPQTLPAASWLFAAFLVHVFIHVDKLVALATSCWVQSGPKLYQPSTSALFTE